MIDKGIPPTRFVVRLRAGNQLTLPDAMLAAIGATAGDRLLVTVKDGAIQLHPVRRSFAGSLKGVYPDDWETQLRAGRDTWRG
jgi:antitoxin component of MazEF toxin-antitoxin module